MAAATALDAANGGGGGGRPAASPEAAAAVDQLKEQGNAQHRCGNFLKAAALYTQGLKADPANAVLFSNRSASLLQLSKTTKALADAEECIRLRPDWDKGYFRKAAVLEALGQLDEVRGRGASTQLPADRLPRNACLSLAWCQIGDWNQESSPKQGVRQAAAPGPADRPRPPRMPFLPCRRSNTTRRPLRATRTASS